MENSNQFDELLTGYLANELNAEDRKTAEVWIDANPENFRYFETLRKTWQLGQAKRALDFVLDEMNVDEKWQHFRQMTASEEAKIIPFAQTKVTESEPGEQLPTRHSFLKKYIIPISVAASVLLVISFGWNLFLPKNEQPVAVTNNETGYPGSIERHIENTTGHDKNVSLPDGSSVVLSNESELMYKEPFVNSRDITLIGKAYFKVTKDKTRPFTVTSGAITTTALGTAFSVTAIKNANSIMVRLYEGKVVVKAVNKSNLRMLTDVYLLPGQEFIYSNDKPGVLRSFALKNKKAPEQITPAEPSDDNPFIQDDNGSWYMFNNQSLAGVLDELATLYNVKILYNKKDVKRIYFTGRYNKTDSLETILARIGKLNTLTVVKNDTAFIIRK